MALYSTLCSFHSTNFFRVTPSHIITSSPLSMLKASSPSSPWCTWTALNSMYLKEASVQSSQTLIHPPLSHASPHATLMGAALPLMAFAHLPRVLFPRHLQLSFRQASFSGPPCLTAQHRCPLNPHPSCSHMTFFAFPFCHRLNRTPCR